MEDEETLKTGALISEFPDTVQHQVNNFLANGVMATGIVVGSIFLAGDQLLRMKELSVGSGTNLVCVKNWFTLKILFATPMISNEICP